jgi:hypothetical protein
MKPMLRAATLAATLVSSLSSCTKGGSAGGDHACVSNDAIMRGLAPTCAGCHAAGPNPFLASARAFDTLFAFNEKIVVPGHPEQSYLIELLQGTAKGTYTQMPLSGDSFVALEAEGKTGVTLAQIESWISQLTPGAKDTTPDPDIVTIKRLSAAQVRKTLYAQLGLTDKDFFDSTSATTNGIPVLLSLGEDNYPVHGPNELPGLFYPEPATRFTALDGTRPTPPFAQALVNISQRWCKMAVAKSDSDKLLFPYVDKNAKSATAADDIKKNLAYWNLHFLGEPADAADIDDVFQNLFMTLETESDTPTAWAGVCSYFIRHPKWIAF